MVNLNTPTQSPSSPYDTFPPQHIVQAAQDPDAHLTMYNTQELEEYWQALEDINDPFNNVIAPEFQEEAQESQEFNPNLNSDLFMNNSFTNQIVFNDFGGGEEDNNTPPAPINNDHNIERDQNMMNIQTVQTIPLSPILHSSTSPLNHPYLLDNDGDGNIDLDDLPPLPPPLVRTPIEQEVSTTAFITPSPYESDDENEHSFVFETPPQTPPSQRRANRRHPPQTISPIVPRRLF